MSDNETTVKARLGYARKFGWIAFELGLGVLVSLVLIDRMTQWWQGPSAYKVYVVGDFSPTGTAPRQVLRGLTEKMSALSMPLTIAGRPLRIEYKNDRGDDRLARQIAAALSRADDTLMVIGHFASTRTKLALPFYLQQADPPVPVILTTETNPDLLPPADLSEAEPYYPVFRLSPTDDQQAAQAAKFAMNEQKCHAFWVIEGEQNPVYSGYLARTFVQRVHAKKGRVVLWTNGSGAAPIVAYTELRKQAGIDCVFFTGDKESAQILLEQLTALDPHNVPQILLSDAAATADLRLAGGADDMVHVIHPLSAAEFSDRDRYRVYGEQAFALLEHLVESANETYEVELEHNSILHRLRTLLNIHRVADARLVVAAAMQRAVLTQTPFELTEGLNSVFRHNGTRDNARFKVWRIGHDGIAELPPTQPDRVATTAHPSQRANGAKLRATSAGRDGVTLSRLDLAGAE